LKFIHGNWIQFSSISKIINDPKFKYLKIDSSIISEKMYTWKIFLIDPTELPDIAKAMEKEEAKHRSVVLLQIVRVWKWVLIFFVLLLHLHLHMIPLIAFVWHKGFTSHFTFLDLKSTYLLLINLLLCLSILILCPHVSYIYP